MEVQTSDPVGEILQNFSITTYSQIVSSCGTKNRTIQKYIQSRQSGHFIRAPKLLIQAQESPDILHQVVQLLEDFYAYRKRPAKKR